MREMKYLIKAILLQSFWFLAVLYGRLYTWEIVALSFIFTAVNFYLYRPQVSLIFYGLNLMLFVAFGLFHDYSLSWLNLVDYRQESFPFWLTSLYVVFLCYYGDLFNYLQKLPKIIQFLLGGLGGLMAYTGGAKLADILILSPLYYVGVTLLWGVFFVLSLKFFYASLRLKN